MPRQIRIQFMDVDHRQLHEIYVDADEHRLITNNSNRSVQVVISIVETVARMQLPPVELYPQKT